MTFLLTLLSVTVKGITARPNEVRYSVVPPSILELGVKVAQGSGGAYAVSAILLNRDARNAFL